MDKGRRRTTSVVALTVVAVLGGAVIALIAFLGRPEAVQDLRAIATFDDTGNARVHESILYYFPQDRHGIYRVLPDVSPDAAGAVQVASDNTDQFTVAPDGAGIRLKIGDPDKTISGAHHYEIIYPLRTVDLGDGHFGWNGVGASWDVPVEKTELDLVAPWTWNDATCDSGRSGAVGDCTVTQPVPGRLEVSHGRLAAGEGITVYATRGAPLATAPAPRSIVATPQSVAWYQRLVVLGGVGGLALLVAALVVARVLRRSGRDLVLAGAASSGSTADLAFGPPDAAGSSTIRVDDSDLAKWATIEFAPPRGLEPWQGSVLAAEAARADASVAWLLGEAIRDRVSISESDPSHPILRRGSAAADPETAALLEVAFAGRDSITLGSYDPSFTSMWTSLPAKMNGWLAVSGFADPRGAGRVSAARIAGVLGVLVGAFVVFAAAKGSSARGVVGIVGVATGSMILGAALAALLRAWELRVRTPAGSAMWLRVESFRRFLAASEAEHVRRAADRGVLREYTAWAVALDEVDHWSAAVTAAGLAPSTPGLSTALAASAISSSIQSAGTTPSSDGAGGGGVGGGGGGGGGGSW